MDATLRQSRRERNRQVGSLAGCLAWAALGLSLIGADSHPGRRAWAIALWVGLPLIQALVALASLVVLGREVWTIRGGQITRRGLFGARSIDLDDVVDARWRPDPPGGHLVLRAGSGSLTLAFAHFEPDEADRLVHALRATLPPEVQADWSTFAAGFAPHARSGPGAGRPRLAARERDFAAALVATALAGAVVAWATGWPVFLAAPLLPILGWMLARVAARRRRMAEGDFGGPPGDSVTGRCRAFLVLWGWAIGAEWFAHEARTDRAMIAGAILWGIVLGFQLLVADWLWPRRAREWPKGAATIGDEAWAD